MKLLLTSSGLVAEEMIEACEQLCNKNRQQISIAMINEAYVPEESDKRWLIRHLNDVATIFGGDVDIVNLLALSPQESIERLSRSDLIYVTGGDADNLMTVIRQQGLETPLRELLKDHPYIGASAGAMVLGQRPSDNIHERVYCETTLSRVGTYMELYDFALLPHLDDEKFPNVKLSNIKEHIDVDDRFYAITREQAIVINGEDKTFVGGDVAHN